MGTDGGLRGGVGAAGGPGAALGVWGAGGHSAGACCWLRSLVCVSGGTRTPSWAQHQQGACGGTECHPDLSLSGGTSASTLLSSFGGATSSRKLWSRPSAGTNSPTSRTSGASAAGTGSAPAGGVSGRRATHPGGGEGPRPSPGGSQPGRWWRHNLVAHASRGAARGPTWGAGGHLGSRRGPEQPGDDAAPRGGGRGPQGAPGGSGASEGGGGEGQAEAGGCGVLGLQLPVDWALGGTPGDWEPEDGLCPLATGGDAWPRLRASIISRKLGGHRVGVRSRPSSLLLSLVGTPGPGLGLGSPQAPASSTASVGGGAWEEAPPTRPPPAPGRRAGRGEGRPEAGAAQRASRRLGGRSARRPDLDVGVWCRPGMKPALQPRPQPPHLQWVGSPAHPGALPRPRRSLKSRLTRPPPRNPAPDSGGGLGHQPSGEAQVSLGLRAASGPVGSTGATCQVPVGEADLDRGRCGASRRPGLWA